jgi:hypothetical protein
LFSGVELIPAATLNLPPEPSVSNPMTIDLDPRSPLEKRMSSLKRLSDLTVDHVLFSHASLFCYGRWQRDPISDYVIEQKGDCQPFMLQMPKPPFRFLDCKDPSGKLLYEGWNFNLVACPKEKWDGLFKFIATLAGVSLEDKFYHSVTWQKLQIPDMLHLNNTAALPDPVPQVECHCLALLSNRYSVIFRPEYRKKLWEPVPVVVGPSLPEVVKYAKRVLRSWTDRPNVLNPPVTINPALSTDDLVKAGLRVDPPQSDNDHGERPDRNGRIEFPSDRGCDISDPFRHHPGG